MSPSVHRPSTPRRAAFARTARSRVADRAAADPLGRRLFSVPRRARAPSVAADGVVAASAFMSSSRVALGRRRARVWRRRARERRGWGRKPSGQGLATRAGGRARATRRTARDDARAMRRT